MTTRSNVVQYDFNLSTNCNDTDLIALIHFFFLLINVLSKNENWTYLFKRTVEKANHIILNDYDRLA